MEGRLLTYREAYLAMVEFLKGYQRETGNKQILNLIGDMIFEPDGVPIDPAAWDDWLEAIDKVVGSE